jgi:hypothetical protein
MDQEKIRALFSTVNYHKDIEQRLLCCFSSFAFLSGCLIILTEGRREGKRTRSLLFPIIQIITLLASV